MGMYDTKGELLEYLDKLTREVSSFTMGDFTTKNIAEGLHMSRSLASQYLNELVREGVAVKINSRPVLFFHKRGFERFLQARLDRCEFDSPKDLAHAIGAEETRDFNRMIGADLSLASCIDHLKSAIQYPPHGIPALIVGEHGTGKQLMSELAVEFGVNAGVLPSSAKFVVVDCSRYEASDAHVETDIFGGPDGPGAVEEAAGGVVFLPRFDHLSHAARDLVLRRICESELDGSAQAPAARFLLATSRSPESDIVKAIARSIPIVITAPRLADRSDEERIALVMHFLRAEGRRVAADVSISRGALRALVNATFEDNVDGLRACITSCCASAYLNHDDEMLIIKTYNLPPRVIGALEPMPDDDQLVTGDKSINDPMRRVIDLFQQVLNPLPSLLEGTISFTEFFANATANVKAYGDYLNFEERSANPRVESYEKLMGPIIEEVNRAYGIELSRRIARSAAQSLYMQLWGGVYLSRWRRKHSEETARALEILEKNLPSASVVLGQIAARANAALGMGFDNLSRVLLIVEIGEVMRGSSRPRDYLGVIMCHGYSTASSIADAADRILHQHVFEAIDMTYDQDVTEAIGQLARLFSRCPHCRSIAILVDMGSLEKINDAVSQLANCDVYIINNVSTGLALEIGTALMSHGDLDAALSRVKDVCCPHYSVVRAQGEREALVFCSESGIEAADKIRRIVRDSIPGSPDVQFITCDFAELAQHGDQARVFESYRIRVVVGTMDPGVPSVPFVGIEDILYEGHSEAIDKALFSELGPEGIAEFHSNLLRNLTLRSVIESITILNPEMLYVEADHAVRKLSELSGEQIDARRRIAVYVHLCGLIERLVTKNFVDTYPDPEGFCAEHGDFVRWFREAFADMCNRYRVEIPVSEIAYVHHMLHVAMAEPGNKTVFANIILEDE